MANCQFLANHQTTTKKKKKKKKKKKHARTDTRTDTMSLAEVYETCCKAQGVEVHAAVVAALSNVREHKLSLRGKGSLRPELPPLVLTDDMLPPILGALKSNTTVFYLDLSYNRLSDSAATDVAHLLEVSQAHHCVSRCCVLAE